MYWKEGRRKADAESAVLVEEGSLPGLGVDLLEGVGGKEEFVIKMLWYGYMQITSLVSLESPPSNHEGL